MTDAEHAAKAKAAFKRAKVLYPTYAKNLAAGKYPDPLATAWGEGLAELDAIIGAPAQAVPIWALTLAPNWNNGQDSNDVARNYNAVWLYGKSVETYDPPNGKDVYRILLLDPRMTDQHGKRGVDEWWLTARRGWSKNYDPQKHGQWADGMNCHNVATSAGTGGGVGWGFGSGVSALHLGWYPNDPAPSLRIEYAAAPANKIMLPVPTRDVVHEYQTRIVAGRTDGSTVRPGEIEIYADGALVKKYTGIDTIQRAQDPATGIWYVQKYMTVWDGDYTKDLPQLATTLLALTGVGQTAAASLADRPVKVLDTIAVQKYRGSGVDLGAPTLVLV